MNNTSWRTEIRQAVRELAANLASFDPDAGTGPALEFSQVAKDYPLYTPSRLLQVPVVGMADFAELGYCCYKSWHQGAGTEERRAARIERRLANGIVIHENKVTAEVREAKKLPKATPQVLRDIERDIYRIPEMPSKIRVGELAYSSSIERAARLRGELVVTEIKTGSYAFAPDHLLQVWGYCLSAPGALRKLTRGDFRAKRITWALEYTARNRTYGPYSFTEHTLDFVKEAMRIFERLYLAGRANVTNIAPNLVGPSSKKCPPCAYFHTCPWKVQTTTSPPS